jgi:SAM-dependent methyltransferase
MDLSSLYQADYVDATYGGLEGIRRNFDRVMGLDPAKSDNAGRVQRVVAFAEAHFGMAAPLSILDVGSGLGVFLAKVRQSTSWTCTAMEPDPRFAQHVRDVLGIEAVAEDYLTNEWNRQFDIITLNKVLEHVEDPAVMLSRCRRDLSPNGLLYVELPDGECAARDADGFGREEFFIEHHHVFTMASMELATRNAGFLSVATERLREPSGKYTLRSFLRPAGNPSATVPS